MLNGGDTLTSMLQSNHTISILYNSIPAPKSLHIFQMHPMINQVIVAPILKV